MTSTMYGAIALNLVFLRLYLWFMVIEICVIRPFQLLNSGINSMIHIPG